MIKHNKGNIYNYKKLFENNDINNKVIFSLRKKKSFTVSKPIKKNV